MQCDVRVVRNLGIYLDSDLIIIIIRQLIRRRNMSIKSLQGRMMRTHVAKTVSSCFAVLRQLRSIRRSVSDPVLQSLVVALVPTKLDYGSRGEMPVRTGPVSTVPGYVVYHQTRDLSGQSTPHMIRSRATHHVIQGMLFTTKHVIYQVKVHLT